MAVSAWTAAAAQDASSPPPPSKAITHTKSPAPAAPTPDHLFGDWNGLRRRLADVGVNFTLDYTTESVANVSGGLRRGAAYAHQIGLTINTDWQTLAGIPGLTTHMSIINRAGNNASADFIGDPVIQAQEIYGAGFGEIAKLVWLYGEESCSTIA